jgi:hypothetical protein
MRSHCQPLAADSAMKKRVRFRMGSSTCRAATAAATAAAAWLARCWRCAWRCCAGCCWCCTAPSQVWPCLPFPQARLAVLCDGEFASTRRHRPRPDAGECWQCGRSEPQRRRLKSRPRKIHPSSVLRLVLLPLCGTRAERAKDIHDEAARSHGQCSAHWRYGICGTGRVKLLSDAHAVSGGG